LAARNLNILGLYVNNAEAGRDPPHEVPPGFTKNGEGLSHLAPRQRVLADRLERQMHPEVYSMRMMGMVVIAIMGIVVIAGSYNTCPVMSGKITNDDRSVINRNSPGVDSMMDHDSSPTVVCFCRTVDYQRQGCYK
jgi:hypothetical protein